MKKLNKILITASVFLFGSYSSLSVAQQSLPVACPGYKQAKTKLLGERSGKKLQKAYEVYLNEEIEEKSRVLQAIQMLREIESREPFDEATVNRFLGQLLVSEDGKQLEALALLTSAA
jgi:hypothetical protein